MMIIRFSAVVKKVGVKVLFKFIISTIEQAYI